MADDLTHLCLYNLPQFSQLNIGPGQRYLRLDYRADDRWIGSLAGVVEGGVFTSGYSAGFGGPDFRREGERLEMVLGLLDHALAELAAQAITTVVIRARPQHYSSAEPYVHFALLRRGFEITSANLNFVLAVGAYGSVEAYVEALKSSARRALRHALAETLIWREAASEADWRAGYDTLAENRRTLHNATLSLSYDYVRRLHETFPRRISLFLLASPNETVAASLFYRITPRHGQVMWWGDRSRGADHGATMNRVAYHTVASALALGLETVDLGPSTADEAINFGGVGFKTNIGAQPNLRYTFRRRLEAPTP